LRITHG
jgi:transposase